MWFCLDMMRTDKATVSVTIPVLFTYKMRIKIIL